MSDGSEINIDISEVELKKKNQLNSVVTDRRTFMQGLVAVGVGLRSKNNASFDQRISQEPAAITGENNEKTEIELDVLKKDILDYRKKLGFIDLPKDFVEAEALGNTEWKLPDNPIANNLPKGLVSYGEYTKYILEKIYGNTLTPQFLQAINFIDSTNYFAGYNRAGVNNSYGLGLVDINIDKFADFALHESAGHAFDPSFHYKTMPFEAYARMAHGRWKMLSQAFSVEGQFFKHPKDLMYPKLLRHTGEEAARYVVIEPDADQICASSSRNKLLKILLQLRSQVARPDGKVYFNNKVSHKFGTMMMEEDVGFSGRTRVVYEYELEDALEEIYAEMIKYLIRNPEKVNNNSEIAQGFAEVISVVRGEPVSPGDIKNIDITVPQDIRDQWIAEQAQVRENFDQVKNKEMARSKIKHERHELFYSGNADFFNEMTQALLDNKLIDTEKKDNILFYIEACNKLYNKFGSQLYETMYQNLEPKFDPDNLHAWTIRDIVYGIDSEFVETLISNIFDGKIEETDWEELQKRKGYLIDFINSPASGITDDRG